MRKTNFLEELFSLNGIQVYHGSDMLVKEPKIMQPRALDFGPGSYTIYGPVANDTIFKTFIAYENGVLSEKETLKRLKVRELYNQLVFANEQALKCLLFCGELM